MQRFTVIGFMALEMPRGMEGPLWVSVHRVKGEKPNKEGHRATYGFVGHKTSDRKTLHRPFEPW